MAIWYHDWPLLAAKWSQPQTHAVFVIKFGVFFFSGGYFRFILLQISDYVIIKKVAKISGPDHAFGPRHLDFFVGRDDPLRFDPFPEPLPPTTTTPPTT